MSEPDSQISCSTHGVQIQTFVCQHIARSLHTRIAVGFHWPRTTEDDLRGAWDVLRREALR